MPRACRANAAIQHCDVAVIGAGISGLSAALAAAEGGARRVVLIDEAQQPGGSGPWHAKTRPQDAARCSELIAARRSPCRACELLCSHSVVGYYADHELAVSRIDREDGGLLLLRARRRGDGHRMHRAACRVPQQRPARRAAGLGGAAPAVPAWHQRGARALPCSAPTTESIALALDLLSQGLQVTDLAVPEGSPLDPDSAPFAALRSAGVRVHERRARDRRQRRQAMVRWPVWNGWRQAAESGSNAIAC